METYRANEDIIEGWYWLSARNTRTCAMCWAMDGTFHKLSDSLDDHPNGRCTAVPKLRGIDLPARQTGVKAFERLSEADALFQEWSPSFREANLLAGLDAILRKIEFNCGLAYGTLSNPQTVDKTATELKISQQRSYATVVDTQEALETALEQLLWAMDVWATIGSLSPRGAYQTVYDFDDSVIVDKDAQFQQDLRLVGQGIMGKVEFRMRNFGEDEATAKARIAEIQNEQQPADLFAGA